MSLERLLAPATVALIGASGTPGKWGYMMMRTLLDGGFGGQIAAVNGRGGEVQGHPAYPTVADLPWAPDVALVTVGREACVDAVEALAARGCRHAVLYAAGFAELGAEGARLQDRMVQAARVAGMRLLGPNCMSLFVARSRLNLTGIPDLRPGRLAFVSQSGNLVYDLVEHGRRSGLGLSLFLSLGNQADLGFEDVLDAVLADPDTGAAALYVEAVRPGRGPAFLEAVHRLARAKPVVALIGGRTDAGRRASMSHTAALLSDVRELRGLLRQAGAIEVARLDELFPVADALLKSPPPPVPTVALCGGGGGHATVGSDAMEARGVALPPPAPETQQALRAIFPPMASVRNPIDWTGASDRSFWAYRDAARLLLADPAIGGLILFGHFGGYLTDLETAANNYRDVAVALGALQRETRKPILLHSIYALQERAAFAALRDAGVPLFESLEIAAAAYRALTDRARGTEALPAPVAAADERLAPYAARARSEGRQALLEPEAWDWLESLGIPVGPRCWARTAEDAVAFAGSHLGPVAMKLASAAILHKSDVGGVRLDVDGAAAVRAAFADLQAAARSRGADFRGTLVVPMAGPGIDVALGVARSDLGGHVLLAGSGGTAVEALDDASVRPAPLTAGDAAAMLDETRVARVLARPRGLPPPPLAPLHDLMVRLAAGCAGAARLEAVDLNPVRVGTDGVRVLDARVLLPVLTAPSVDFTPSPRFVEIQARARAFVESVLEPLEVVCDAGDGLPPDVEARARDAARESGLFAPNMPAEWGGAGLDVLEQVALEEELGRATNCLWAIMWRPANVLVHCTDAQRARYLLPYIRGEFRGCYAVTEPGAGSDTTRLATEARPDGDGFVISGEKWFATGGDIARFFMVVADVLDGPRRRPTIFLVDRDAPGFTVGRTPRFTHSVVYSHPELRLEDVRVGPGAVLGGVGLGMELTKDWFRDERLMIAARCLGAAQRALELAQAWALERHASGRPLAEHQAVQWMLADSACELAAARALTHKVAWEVREGADPKVAHARASMVKLHASEMAGRVTDRAVQIFGGRGYLRDNPVERLWRDTRVDRIWEGTSEIQRLIIARGLAKRGVELLTR